MIRTLNNNNHTEADSHDVDENDIEWHFHTWLPGCMRLCASLFITLTESVQYVTYYHVCIVLYDIQTYLFWYLFCGVVFFFFFICFYLSFIDISSNKQHYINTDRIMMKDDVNNIEIIVWQASTLSVWRKQAESEGGKGRPPLLLSNFDNFSCSSYRYVRV